MSLVTNYINVEDLSPEQEQRSALQVAGILEDFIDNWGVEPDEITLGFKENGGIDVAFSGVLMGTIKRTFDGNAVEATFLPRNVS